MTMSARALAAKIEAFQESLAEMSDETEKGKIAEKIEKLQKEVMKLKIKKTKKKVTKVKKS